MASTPAKSNSSLYGEDMESLPTPDEKGDNHKASSGKSTKNGASISCSKLATAIEENLNMIDKTFQEEFQIRRPVRKPLWRFYSFDIRRSLLTPKRPADNNVEDISPGAKRIRDETLTTPKISFTENSPKTAIVDALEKLCGDTEFIADGSKPYCLPTVRGKHSDLKLISPNTVADVLKGSYSDQVESCTIIDCRYPYEYEAGHIKGAINMYCREEVITLLYRPLISCSGTKRNILIFHCEFSSERGPKLNRFLRNQDRELHKGDYPQLTYPEVYLLEGGYKAFYDLHKDLCDPCGYKPMLHQDHVKDLRYFRGKSKSWSAGEKLRKTRFAL
ncbi:hypothetical protein CHS0354_007106 [Potamilus streckersoni]|uniref:M-phase inducer phosphatase n=1 Tax=Potamilus streckersoni TaxID=2493646 RepID=A0AAE0TB59_9BIVA|nr:hypothetical protein CHS0354_007106 [Potamilus streckersoni]